MSAPPPDGKRGAVGIYDRPASADRPNRKLLIVAVLIAVAAAVIGYLFFWPQAPRAGLDGAPTQATSVGQDDDAHAGGLTVAPSPPTPYARRST